MVALGGIEGLEGFDFRDYGPGVNLRRVELRDVGLSDALLLRAGVEDGRAVLRAGIRTLAIPLRGIVRDGEKNLQELAVAELRWIIGDADGFGVAGKAQGYALVGRRLEVAARVAGGHGRNSLKMLENGLDAPEATSGKNRGLLARGSGQRRIDGRRGEGCFRSFRRPRAKCAESSPRDQANNYD